MRAALGGGLRFVVAQLLAESAVLAVFGGAAALAVAGLVLAFVRRVASAALPGIAAISLHGSTVVMAGALAIATALVLGVAPALAVVRSDPQGVLRDDTRGASEARGSRRVRRLLVAAQIGLCLSLLAAAGLLGRSLLAMAQAPLGFDPDRVLTFDVRLPNEYATPESLRNFYDQFTERLRALPGVQAIASASMMPTVVHARMGSPCSRARSSRWRCRYGAQRE